MPDQIIPPGVWTKLHGDAGTVLNETGVSATVTVDEGGTVTFAAPMKWRPSVAEPVTEHAERYTSGAMLVRNSASEVERVYPLEQWIPDQQAHGGRIFKRRVIVVEGWTEIPRSSGQERDSS